MPAWRARSDQTPLHYCSISACTLTYVDYSPGVEHAVACRRIYQSRLQVCRYLMLLLPMNIIIVGWIHHDNEDLRGDPPALHRTRAGTQTGEENVEVTAVKTAGSRTALTPPPTPLAQYSTGSLFQLVCNQQQQRTFFVFQASGRRIVLQQQQDEGGTCMIQHT